jgi:formylglycine-generating enzyme required for sulfatase activity
MPADDPPVDPPATNPEPAAQEPPPLIGPAPRRDDTRLAPPKQDELEAALSAVQDVFGDDEKQANTPEKKVALAARMLAKAGDVAGVPAQAFALTLRAQQHAVAAGDVELATKAVDQRAKQFAVDTLAEKRAAITQAGKQPLKQTGYLQLSAAAQAVAQTAADDERFDLAGELTKLAVAASGKSKNRDAMREANRVDKDVQERLKEFREAEDAHAKWQANPEDPAASLTLGRYVAFRKGDWSRGIKILKHARDETLRELARLELAGSSTPSERMALGEAWQAAGEAKPAAQRTPYLARAKHWYQEALPGLVGLEKDKVMQRLEKLEAGLLNEAAGGPGKPVRLALGPGVAIQLQWIPAGRFMMGSPSNEPGRRPTEQQHPVAITRPFYLGLTEVTQEQWQAVMGSNPSANRAQTNLPVEQVSWEACQEFCAKLQEGPHGRRFQFRLPTEAEWEYACRAGTQSPYWFGDPRQARLYAWGIGTAQQTMPVAKLRPNAWGLYDMSGNVMEWCADWDAPYERRPQTDPTGPPTGLKRINRGGAVTYGDLNSLRSANRESNRPDFSTSFLGFRLAASPL